MFDNNTRHRMPRTVEEAAELLLSDLLMQQLSALSHMTENDFDQLCDHVSPFLLEEFKIWQGNNALLDSCFSRCGSEPDPARVILNEVKEILNGFNGFLVIT